MAHFDSITLNFHRYIICCNSVADLCLRCSQLYMIFTRLKNNTQPIRNRYGCYIHQMARSQWQKSSHFALVRRRYSTTMYRISIQFTYPSYPFTRSAHLLVHKSCTSPGLRSHCPSDGLGLFAHFWRVIHFKQALSVPLRSLSEL